MQVGARSFSSEGETNRWKPIPVRCQTAARNMVCCQLRSATAPCVDGSLMGKPPVRLCVRAMSKVILCAGDECSVSFSFIFNSISEHITLALLYQTHASLAVALSARSLAYTSSLSLLLLESSSNFPPLMRMYVCEVVYSPISGCAGKLTEAGKLTRTAIEPERTRRWISVLCWRLARVEQPPSRRTASTLAVERLRLLCLQGKPG